MARAMEQEPSPDGVRRFKAAIVRNTEPDMKRTTVATWLSIFPEEACGPMVQTAPMRHHIRIRPKNFKWIDREAGTYEGSPGLDLLVEFMSLDKPKDVRKLLSFEGTLIWFNEVREIPKSLVDMATDRVGRYPSKEQGGVECTWYGIILDTNPPDQDHWIYRLEKGVDEYGEYVGRPSGWSFYFQPPAVLEVVQVAEKEWRTVESEPFKYTVYDPRHVHRAAKSLWCVNPQAENIYHLQVNKALDPTGDPFGPGSYYIKSLSSKDRDWIVCYYQGRYQFVREGKPVIPDFDELAMVVDDLPIANAPPQVGADIGGNTLNPAGVLFQRGPRGMWLVHNECIASDMGLDRFSDELSFVWADTFGSQPCAHLWGDPAGRTRDGIFETVAFQHLIAKGWPARPAPSQDIKVRVDAIKAPMGRNIDGRPGILIHRRCTKLIKALNGAWCYRRINTSGQERYSETPDKTHPWSDIGDALGYGLSGAGETRALNRGTQQVPGEGAGRIRPGVVTMAKTNFDVFSRGD
jgi:hypothetical protein